MAKKNIEKQIIKAASAVFLKKGMDGARMQEIAATAGINQALLHYYFRSKEKLFEAVFTDLMKNLFASVFSAISSDGNFKDLLRDFIASYSQNIAERSELVRFILWEIQRGGHLLIKNMQEMNFHNGESPPEFLMAKIEQAKKDGQIRDIDTKNFLLTLIGALLYPFIARPLLENMLQIEDLTDETFIKKRNDEIFNVLWQGIKK